MRITGTVVRTSGEWKHRAGGRVVVAVEVKTEEVPTWTALMDLKDIDVDLVIEEDSADAAPHEDAKAEGARTPAVTTPASNGAAAPVGKSSATDHLANHRPDTAKSACGWWDILDDEGSPVRTVYCKAITGHEAAHSWAVKTPALKA